MSQYKFKLKTHEAYYFKVLAELLSNNLKTACFEISKDNIKLCFWILKIFLFIN